MRPNARDSVHHPGACRPHPPNERHAPGPCSLVGSHHPSAPPGAAPAPATAPCCVHDPQCRRPPLPSAPKPPPRTCSRSSSFLLRPQITTACARAPSCPSSSATVSSSAPMPSPPPTSSTVGSVGWMPSCRRSARRGLTCLEKMGRIGRPAPRAAGRENHPDARPALPQTPRARPPHWADPPGHLSARPPARPPPRRSLTVLDDLLVLEPVLARQHGAVLGGHEAARGVPVEPRVVARGEVRDHLQRGAHRGVWRHPPSTTAPPLRPSGRFLRALAPLRWRSRCSASPAASRLGGTVLGSLAPGPPCARPRRRAHSGKVDGRHELGAHALLEHAQRHVLHERVHRHLRGAAGQGSRAASGRARERGAHPG